uniref:Uncharacterized protein n=1 Tax=Marseillevirus LCMAC101 TaxID=2506602 RepID=A0A481YQU1_9VIRU|nr:MAG: hypothetical protein LCMAC101_01490 [Marseillevirus LCMAC101]
MTDKCSEGFKEMLFKEREADTPFAAFWDECPNVGGKPGFSRGYRLYKLLQLLEKKNEQTPEKKERDIKKIC